MKEKCIHCFRVLSVPARFKIYQHLKKSRRSVPVNELVKLLSLRQPTVTFHVKALERVGLIKKTRVGRSVNSVVHIRCKPCPLFD